jgi:hypothetical protein
MDVRGRNMLRLYTNLPPHYSSLFTLHPSPFTKHLAFSAYF